MKNVLRRLALSLLLIVLWMTVPIGLVFGIAYLVGQYPPVTIASTRGVSDHSWDDGYAYAQGTWVMENNEIGSPQNEAAISCRREIALCIESSAEIFRGGGNMRLLVNRVDTFSIDQWTADSITYSNADGCTRYTVNINRRTQSVTAQREPDPNGSASSCPSVGVIRDDVLRTSLQDGWRVQQRLERDALSRTQPWLWFGFGVWLLCVLGQLWRIWRRPLVDQQVAPG